MFNSFTPSNDPAYANVQLVHHDPELNDALLPWLAAQEQDCSITVLNDPFCCLIELHQAPQALALRVERDVRAHAALRKGGAS